MFSVFQSEFYLLQLQAVLYICAFIWQNKESTNVLVYSTRKAAKEPI